MKYIYYKDKLGNFGDDLNQWLWPKIFTEQNNNHVFIGIGTILSNETNLFRKYNNEKKIVFGTGVRPDFKPFLLDETWDIKFLRGPLSSYSLGNKHEYITDGAYTLRQLEFFNTIKNKAKIHKISLIPHFNTIKYFDWKSICNELGINLISPLAENGIDNVLTEIITSDFIITEALHGAIIADICRVPWSRFVLATPYTEGAIVSEFKWMDWLFSINIGQINSTTINFYRKTFLNKFITHISHDIISPEFLFKYKIKNDIINKLSKVNNFYLSDENTLHRIDERIFEKILEIKNI